MSHAKTLIGILLSLSAAFSQAAEVRILAANAFAAVFAQLGPSFERDTGHRLIATFTPTAAIQKKIDTGEPFDVVITNASTIDGWAKSGVVDDNSRTPIAFTGLGLGVRAGAPKPDVSTVAASRQALLAAKSIARSTESASAAAFQTLVARLGISDSVKDRLFAIKLGDQAGSVARGEAEMVIAVVPSILATAGVQLAGVFPKELQIYTTFSAAMNTNSNPAQGASALILMMTSAAAKDILMAQGMGTGSP